MNSIIPLRILLVTPLPPPAGGIASWSAGVLGELKTRPSVKISLVDTSVRWRSTNDKRLHARFLGGLAQSLFDTYKVFRAIRASKPNVLHLCTSGSLAAFKDFFIVMITQAYNIKCIIHYHFGRLPTVVERGGWEWYLIRWAMRHVDTVLVLDKESAEAIRNCLPNVRVELIPNPIDVRLVAVEEYSQTLIKTANSDNRIIFVGHVIPTKGIRELVLACLYLSTNRKLELKLVGQIEDDFRKELCEIARAQDDGRWLKFAGQVNRGDAIASISTADIFVLPSYTEGFPNVILEAMVLGKPIVATRVGAIPEMLDEDTITPCGLLVTPKNINELQNAIGYFLDYPEYAAEYGQLAKKKVHACYTMGEIVNQYVRLWSLNRK